MASKHEDGASPVVRIRPGWHEAGKRGLRLGPDVRAGGQLWTPVLWDGDEDPTFHKTAGIEATDGE